MIFRSWVVALAAAVVMAMFFMLLDADRMAHWENEAETWKAKAEHWQGKYLNECKERIQQ